MADNNGNGGPPKDTWVESAHQLIGTNIDFARGGVQFVGKHAILVGDVAVTVPFNQLLAIIGSVFMLMDSRQPAHAIVRRALLGESEGEPELAEQLRRTIETRQLSLVPPGA